MQIVFDFGTDRAHVVQDAPHAVNLFHLQNAVVASANYGTDVLQKNDVAGLEA